MNEEELLRLQAEAEWEWEQAQAASPESRFDFGADGMPGIEIHDGQPLNVYEQALERQLSFNAENPPSFGESAKSFAGLMLQTAKIGSMLVPGMAAGGWASRVLPYGYKIAGSSIAGAAAADTAGFVFDQGLEGLGIQEGRTVTDEATKKVRPTSFWEDAKDLPITIARDAAIGAGVGYGAAALSKVVGATVPWLRSKIARRLDPDANLTAAFDDGSNLADKTGVLTAETSQPPLGDVTKRVKGYTYSHLTDEEIQAMQAAGMSENQIAAQNSKRVLDPADVMGDTPFESTSSNINAALQRTGQEVDEFVNQVEKKIPYGRVVDKRFVQDRLLRSATGKDTSATHGVLNKEIDEFAQKVLTKDEYVELSEYSKVLERLETRQIMARSAEAMPGTASVGSGAAKPLSYGEEEMLKRARSRVAELTEKVAQTPIEPREALRIKRGFEGQANFLKSGKDPSQAAVYEDLATSARTALDESVTADLGEQGFNQWRGLNQKYQDLNRLNPLAARKANVEMNPPTSFPGADTVRSVFTTRGPSAYVRPTSGGLPGSTTNLRRGVAGYSPGLTAADRTAELVGAGGSSLGTVPGQSGSIAAASAVANSRGVDTNGPGMVSSANAESPTGIDHLPNSLSVNLNPPKATARRGFQLPRNISLINAQGLANVLAVSLPPEIAAPLLIQWKTVDAKGDPVEKAKYLSALTAQFPDLPIQRGIITGMASEFDLGDGRTRLFSPLDKQRWEEQIERSPLRNDEKAIRVMELRRDGLVYDFNRKLSQDVSPKANEEREQQRSVENAFKNRPASPRQRNALGSRRVN